LLRIEQAGVSAARNAGAREADGDYIAYIDDDAIPAPDWVERILEAIGETDPPPALIGGRILPHWEAPLPSWWPAGLRGSLSIIEAEGQGEYRTAALPHGLEPYGANMVIHVPSLRAIGGFGRHSGRIGDALLSDEEVQLAWKLQSAGHSARYDSRVVVRHQIQAARLTPTWLLSRLYWQGISTVRTRRLLGRPGDVWQELPRRILVAGLLAPTGLLPRHSRRLVSCRWRLAYALGFIQAALGWDVAAAPARGGG
jgi:glycosyltransferase involved in cell wall biosynthesis